MTPRDLRQRRLSLGWSLSEVARRVGVSVTVVAQWEDGSAPINPPSALEQILGELEYRNDVDRPRKIVRGDYSGRKEH